MVESNREQHNQLQKEYFDKRAELFRQPIPEDVHERTLEIIKRAHLRPGDCILDVGTGGGVLIGHFLAAGVAQTNIVGCDLSQHMLANARAHFPAVFFWHGDFLDFHLTPKPPGLPPNIDRFDSIFFNACFANMLDRRRSLTHCLEVLRDDGQVVISHPAPEFVSALHVSDPEIVPHLLPNRDELDLWCKELGFSMADYACDALFYLAILKRGERRPIAKDC